MEYNFKIKKIHILIILISIFITITTVTLAFYNQHIIKQNNYYTANYKVTLEQSWNDTWGDKSITILNRGNTKVALRLNYNESWSKQIDNEKIIINNMYQNTNVVNIIWTNEFLNNFTYIDGYYYYNLPLEPNTEITILEGITKLNTYGSYNYDNYNYEISIYYETVQYTNNAINKLWSISPKLNESYINWKE